MATSVTSSACEQPTAAGECRRRRVDNGGQRRGNDPEECRWCISASAQRREIKRKAESAVVGRDHESIFSSSTVVAGAARLLEMIKS